jgi:hypothetical protein
LIDLAFSEFAVGVVLTSCVLNAVNTIKSVTAFIADVKMPPVTATFDIAGVEDKLRRDKCDVIMAFVNGSVDYYIVRFNPPLTVTVPISFSPP